MTRIIKRGASVLAGAALIAGGAAIGSATPAHADSGVWDRVAQCESGGNWGISTGNGYYGGLQFSQSTWSSHGGQGSAANASKAEQIRVAQRVLQTQGPGAWPVCSVKAGLTKSNGGAASASSASESTQRQTTTKQSTAKQSTQKSVAKSTGTQKAASKKATPKRSTGSYVKSNATPKRAVASGRVVTVKPGDTLAKIAARYGVEGGWQALYQKNADKISNPNQIFVGQQLSL